MIAQSVALCIIAVCAMLLGVGILRGMVAFDRYLRAKDEAQFRGQMMLASAQAEAAEARQAVDRG